MRGNDISDTSYLEFLGLVGTLLRSTYSRLVCYNLGPTLMDHQHGDFHLPPQARSSIFLYVASHLTYSKGKSMGFGIHLLNRGSYHQLCSNIGKGKKLILTGLHKASDNNIVRGRCHPHHCNKV